MAQDNEWGIEDIDSSDTTEKVSAPSGETTDFMEHMPGKEVTADLTNAISRDIIEDAVKNGIVPEDDIKPIDDMSPSSPVIYEEAYDEVKEPVGEIHIKEKRKETDKAVSVEEDDESEKKDKLLVVLSIVVLALIVIVGTVILIVTNKNKPSVRDDYEEEEDYEITDIYGSNNDTSVREDAHSHENDNGNDNNNADADDDDDDDKPQREDGRDERTQCEINGHQYAEATCTEPRKCTVCGRTEGSPLGHDFKDATCTEPATCRRCGETGTAALGHHYKEADCTNPETCTVCGETKGEPLGHDYTEATCTAPATCRRCGQTVGQKTDHNFVETSTTTEGGTKTVTYTCSVCGEVKTEQETIDEPMSGSYAQQVIDCVNADRAANGLAPVTSTPELMNAAQARATEISTSFSHTRPDGSDCFSILPIYGVNYNTCGENIAAGQISPLEVEKSWMNSSGHRANILNAGFTHIGVGYCYTGSGYSYYWVQLFTN